MPWFIRACAFVEPIHFVTLPFFFLSRLSDLSTWYAQQSHVTRIRYLAGFTLLSFFSLQSKHGWLRHIPCSSTMSWFSAWTRIWSRKIRMVCKHPSIIRCSLTSPGLTVSSITTFLYVLRPCVVFFFLWSSPSRRSRQDGWSLTRLLPPMAGQDEIESKTPISRIFGCLHAKSLESAMRRHRVLSGLKPKYALVICITLP